MKEEVAIVLAGVLLVLLSGSIVIASPLTKITVGVEKNVISAQENNGVLPEMNTAVSGGSKLTERNTGIKPMVDQNTETTASNATKRAQELEKRVTVTTENAKNVPTRAQSIGTKEHRKSSTRRGRTPVQYRPSKYVAIPLPKSVVSKAAAKKMEESGRIKCGGDACTLLVEKNAPNKQMAQALKAIIGNVSRNAKIRAAIIRSGDYAVAKAVVVEQNRTDVSYATADQGIFAVTVEIPKSEINSAALIEGNVVFLRTDPILRIYLRSENNEIAVAKFSIKKAVELNTNDSIEFASCTIGVKNVNYDPSDGTLRFQMSDGNQPVYIPSVKIVAPGTLVLPQYDSKTKTYTAKIGSARNTKIEAYVDGCGQIIYPLAESAQNSKSNGGIAAILVILGIIAAAVVIVARA